MDAPTDVLRDSKGRGKGVDGTGRVCEDGEFRHPQIITNNGDIIYPFVSRKVLRWWKKQLQKHTWPTERIARFIQ